MIIQKFKQWLSTVVTVLLVAVLFGIIFVQLDIVEPTPTFFIEVAIIATLMGIVRFFWYSDGEDKAAEEEDIKTTKKDYAYKVDSNILSQEDFEEYLKYLNYENRSLWIKNALKGRTKTNCDNYDEIYKKLVIKSYKRVKPVTISQILTRSAKNEVITAKDYTKIYKLAYQISSVVISLVSSVVLATLAYKNLMLSWTNVFRYLTYLFSIVWAIFTSYVKGYKTYKKETIDHISRLTMIVNRYEDWKKGDVKQRWLATQEASSEQPQQIMPTLKSNDSPNNKE